MPPARARDWSRRSNPWALLVGLGAPFRRGRGGRKRPDRGTLDRFARRRNRSCRLGLLPRRRLGGRPQPIGRYSATATGSTPFVADVEPGNTTSLGRTKVVARGFHQIPRRASPEHFGQRQHREFPPGRCRKSRTRFDSRRAHEDRCPARRHVRAAGVLDALPEAGCTTMRPASGRTSIRPTARNPSSGWSSTPGARWTSRTRSSSPARPTGAKAARANPSWKKKLKDLRRRPSTRGKRIVGLQLVACRRCRSESDVTEYGRDAKSREVERKGLR